MAEPKSSLDLVAALSGILASVVAVAGAVTAVMCRKRRGGEETRLVTASPSELHEPSASNDEIEVQPVQGQGQEPAGAGVEIA